MRRFDLHTFTVELEESVAKARSIKLVAVPRHISDCGGLEKLISLLEAVQDEFPYRDVEETVREWLSGRGV